MILQVVIGIVVNIARISTLTAAKAFSTMSPSGKFDMAKLPSRYVRRGFVMGSRMVWCSYWKVPRNSGPPLQAVTTCIYIKSIFAFRESSIKPPSLLNPLSVKSPSLLSPPLFLVPSLSSPFYQAKFEIIPPLY